jgi:hypothetical protein
MWFDMNYLGQINFMQRFDCAASGGSGKYLLSLDVRSLSTGKLLAVWTLGVLKPAEWFYLAFGLDRASASVGVLFVAAAKASASSQQRSCFQVTAAILTRLLRSTTSSARWRARSPFMQLDTLGALIFPSSILEQPILRRVESLRWVFGI